MSETLRHGAPHTPIALLRNVAAWAVAGACLSAGLAAAAEPTAAEAAGLIAQLDDGNFEVRRRAAARLEELAQREEDQQSLGKTIQETLLAPDTSFEVRRQLEMLRKQLPPSALPVPPADVSAEQISQLIRQLDAGKYSERVGAAARLSWLVTRPELACEIMTRLKGIQADASVSAEARKQLRPIAEAAREVWLTSEPKHWRLPAVSDAEIRGWLDQLQPEPLAPDAPPAMRKAWLAGQEAAQQELLDLLARDDYLERVKAAIQERLARRDLNDATRVRLEALLDWTRPAMVAEFWEEKHNGGTQYLLVGVPSQTEGARRPSHFDRIDDHTAHCVSGNSLSPGDYPVGVLFPHPETTRNAQFQLVNLPTPRRRMAYEYHVKIDEAVRLREVSERTLIAIAAQKRPLGEAELCMVQHMDDGAVSRFAGAYFMAVGDPVPPDRKEQHALGRASPCTNLCQVLTELGTHDAIEGLLGAIKAGKFPEPTPEAPENWPWIAAMSIAERDPRPQDEPWLASLIERTDPLRKEGANPPELGATAAAILLMRHNVPLAKFGLESAEDRMLAESGAPDYRFTSPEMRQKAIGWWADQKPPVAQSSPSAP